MNHKQNDRGDMAENKMYTTIITEVNKDMIDSSSMSKPD